MSYVYRKKKQIINRGSSQGEKFIAAIAPQGECTEEDLMRYMERNSSISGPDITLLYYELAGLIEEFLMQGEGVCFEGLGTFLPNFRTKPEPNYEDITVENVKEVVVNFRPSRNFIKRMQSEKLQEEGKYK